MSDFDFNTPPWFLDLVRKLSPTGRIGLDPCSNSFSVVSAEEIYRPPDDGLAHSWRGHGLVFVNPPHSMSPNNIEPWMKKAHEEFIGKPLDTFDDTPQDQLVMLVPAKTDTEWFHRHASKFVAHCFLEGRPRFWHQGRETEGPGKFASLVIYHGPNTGIFMGIFGPYGWIV